MNQNARQSTMQQVMNQLGNREREISNMLPPDLPIERFQANVLNALRNTPSILDATASSIVKACMKAAYDGLRIDGKEAAIVVHKNTYGKGSDAREVKEAEYFPMAFGLIQQVLRGGEVIAIEVEVIRQNDHYIVRKGTNSGIEHEINLNDGRGEIIGAYSVATLKSGYKTFEILDRNDLSDIKAAAKTDKVWKRWFGEMCKKSAVRRHRKTLPLGERDLVINDSEAAELYGDIDPGRESLPAPSNQRERPTRDTARAAIEDRKGTESGSAMDLGHDEDGVVIENGQNGQQQESETKKDLPGTDNSAETLKGDEPAGDMPVTEDEWSLWSQDVEASIHKADTADAVNAIAAEEEPRLKAASKERADFLRGLITDRLTDFATSGEGES